VVYALPVGRRPLLNQDEARFALLAREAVEFHHWLLPRVRGVIYLNKPPLYFWAVAVLAKPFGVVNETTAPLASVVAAGEKTGSRLTELLENLVRFLPWTVFLPAGLWWWWRDRDPRRRPLLVWTAVIAVAVSLSGEQRARYFLPVLPPLSLLVAEVLARAPLEPSGRGRRVLLASFAGVTLGAVGAAVVLLQMGPGDGIFVPPPGWPRGVIAALAVAGGAAALGLLAVRRSGVAATLVLALALGGILIVEGWTYPARYAERTNIRGFTAAVAERLPPDARIITYLDAGLVYDFYLRRSIQEMPKLADLDARLAAPRPGDAVLIREDRWATMRADHESRWQVLLADRVGRHRMVLLAPRP
jgi:4-amino-4-deoxy-L-arabinose transferase-like glycosyltransferase